MTFLPSTNGSSLPQKADGNGGFMDAVPGIDYRGYLYKCYTTVTITNTTTPTSTSGAGLGSKILPANWLTLGKTIEIDGGGVYSAAAIAPGNLVVNVLLNSTIIATTALGALVSGAAALAYNFEAVIMCRSTGTSGTVICHGDIDYNIGVARDFGDLTNGGNATTIDTTIAQTVDVQVAWQTASASNIIKNTFVTIEAL